MSQYQYGNVEFPAWAVKYLFPECRTEAEAYFRLALDYSGQSARVLTSLETVRIDDGHALNGSLPLIAELERLHVGYDGCRGAVLEYVRFGSDGRKCETTPLFALSGERLSERARVQELEEDDWRELMCVPRIHFAEPP